MGGARTLYETESVRLVEAAKWGRHGIRNYLLVLMICRRGLRVTDAIGLRHVDINLDQAHLWVRRLRKKEKDTYRAVCGESLSSWPPLTPNFLEEATPDFKVARTRLQGDAKLERSDRKGDAVTNGGSRLFWTSPRDAVYCERTVGRGIAL